MGWYGSVVSIPSGWHLCDGSVGTPDLRGKFIVGAGGTYDPGDTGGADSQTHEFTGDGHYHDGTPGVGHAGGADFGTQTTVVPAFGTTDPADNRPAFYAFCWIMKL